MPSSQNRWTLKPTYIIDGLTFEDDAELVNMELANRLCSSEGRYEWIKKLKERYKEADLLNYPHEKVQISKTLFVNLFDYFECIEDPTPREEHIRRQLLDKAEALERRALYTKDDIAGVIIHTPL